MAHPLFDRRDLTRARAQQDAPAPAGAERAGELAETNRLLRNLLRQQRSSVQQLCVTDREPPEQRMEQFPLAGATRLIVRRTGAGGNFTLVVNVPALVLDANENRLGGRIVNSGANPVTLYLSSDLLTPGGGTPLTEGVAQIRLTAGAAWDLKLGDVLWCGHVIALDTVGGSVVYVAEV